MTFADDYVEQTKKAMEDMHDRLFPPKVIARLEARAKADIAAGRNKCVVDGDPTTEMLYPAQVWICRACANRLFHKGILGNGSLVFDMKEPTDSTHPVRTTPPPSPNAARRKAPSRPRASKRAQ